MEDALLHLQKVDAHLAELITHYPAPTFSAHTDYYEALVSSIISQQLSVKAARSIEEKFKTLFGGELPAPEQIIASDLEQLRAVGLSRPKASYILDLAQKIIDGSVRFEKLDELSNQTIIDELTKIKGIGVWTVHMFLIFCMRRLDVLPYGDLGIRNGIGKLYDFTLIPTPEEVMFIATKNNWHPYESVASWYIWRSLQNTPQS